MYTKQLRSGRCLNSLGKWSHSHLLWNNWRATTDPYLYLILLTFHCPDRQVKQQNTDLDILSGTLSLSTVHSLFLLVIAQSRIELQANISLENWLGVRKQSKRTQTKSHCYNLIMPVRQFFSIVRWIREEIGKRCLKRIMANHCCLIAKKTAWSHQNASWAQKCFYQTTLVSVFVLHWAKGEEYNIYRKFITTDICLLIYYS